MPLSEHEQRVLEQLERALTAEDPRFASKMQPSQMHRAVTKTSVRRRTTIGVVGALLGLALVLVGVNTTTWLGAAGFALMVGAVAYAVWSPRIPPPGPRSRFLGSRTRSGDQ